MKNDYKISAEEKFDLNGFTAYIEQKYSHEKSPFLRSMIENIVGYALKTKGHTLDGIAYLLEELIPEIEFGEIAMFASESMLTAYGKDMAKLMRAEWEAEKCQSNM